jgi:hypothetical protein
MSAMAGAVLTDFCCPAILREHFQVLFEIIYGPSPYFHNQATCEMVQTLRADIATLVTVVQQTRRGAQPFSKRTLSLLNGQFFCQFRSHRSRSQFEAALLCEFPKYFPFVANGVGLVADICRFSGVPAATCDGLNADLAQLRADFERELKRALDVAAPPPHNIAAVIGAAIARVRSSLDGELADTNERMEVMRYKNHTCPLCKLRPAIYYAEPCRHPTFCQGCMLKLRDVGTVFTHCYACQTKVDSVQALQYLVLP